MTVRHGWRLILVVALHLLVNDHLQRQWLKCIAPVLCLSIHQRSRLHPTHLNMPRPLSRRHAIAAWANQPHTRCRDVYTDVATAKLRLRVVTIPAEVTQRVSCPVTQATSVNTNRILNGRKKPRHQLLYHRLDRKWCLTGARASLGSLTRHRQPNLQCWLAMLREAEVPLCHRFENPPYHLHVRREKHHFLTKNLPLKSVMKTKDRVYYWNKYKCNDKLFKKRQSKLWNIVDFSPINQDSFRRSK